MRALLPRSPRTTTAARMQEIVGGGPSILPGGHLAAEAANQVRRHAAPVLRGRTDIVDRRDLRRERTLDLISPAAGGDCRFGLPQAKHGRPDAAGGEMNTA